MGAAQGKIFSRSSVWRHYETNRCFPSSARLEPCGLDASSGATHDSRAERSPISKGNQEAGEDVEEGKQESRESATEGKQAGEPSSELAFRVDCWPRISKAKTIHSRSPTSRKAHQLRSKRRHRFAKTGTCLALSKVSSAVTKVRANTRAVATRKRSAGSRWGSCTRPVSCATW